MAMTEQGRGKPAPQGDGANGSQVAELDSTGVETVTRGMEELEAAQGLAKVGQQQAMYAASDVTLGAAEFKVARAAEGLGAMAAVGALVDVAQAGEVLLTADQVAEMSGAVRSMSADDLERALDLGAISGQLAVVSDLAFGLEMITLGEFLHAKSRQLRGHAVEAVLLMQGNRDLARSMHKVSNRMAGVGVTELARASVKMGLAEGLQAKSEELAERGADDVALGLDEARSADAIGEAAKALAQEGIEDLAVGSGEIGAAIAVAEAAKPPAG